MSNNPANVTLGGRIGVTDEWLRVWRVILFNKSNAASLISGLVTPDTGSGQLSAAPAGTFIMSSEVNTGQPPGLMTYAAGLRIVFQVNTGNAQTPNTAEITIYNLSDNTANSLIQEFNYVILQAGYEWGQAGTIFTGSIKFYKKGHESATDSYLTIYAADGDQAINGATINKKFAEGTTPQDKVKGLQQPMQQFDVQMRNDIQAGAGLAMNNSNPSIRPETEFGMAADCMRDFAAAKGALWYILNQQFVWAAPQSYLPGTIVQLNALTGLVGFPEFTPQGLNFTCLINSSIQLGQRVQLDNSLINQYFQPGGQAGVSGVAYQNWAIDTWYYPANADGIYAPVHINYEGDSRGGPWYMYVIALAVDPSTGALINIPGGQDWNSITA